MADKEKVTGGSPAEMSAEEVLQKFDKESDKREMDGLWGHLDLRYLYPFCCVPAIYCDIWCTGRASAAHCAFMFWFEFDLFAVPGAR